jgi:hypothetical protein
VTSGSGSARNFFQVAKQLKHDAKFPSGMLGTLTGSGITLFDNRKAGKSTPIIWNRLRSVQMPWCGLLTSLLELSKSVEEIRRTFQLFVEAAETKAGVKGLSVLTQSEEKLN